MTRPDTPVYGVWVEAASGAFWLMELNGGVVHSPFRNALVARMRQANLPEDWQVSVREIGPDGLPVPDGPAPD